MLEAIDVAQDVMLIDALCAEVSPPKRAQLLARLRKQQEDTRAALREEANALDKSFQDARRDAVDPERLEESVGEKERATAERARPAIEALQQKLAAFSAALDPEIRQAIQESLDLLEAWLALYQDLRERLRNLSAERQNGDGILRANPILGEIDHKKLTREIIARFPKILAALAK